ncbi:MAG TPA: hypothetical protein VGM98_06460, partial [Schlesneria sp.]
MAMLAITLDPLFTQRIVRAAALTDFFNKLESKLNVRESDSFAAVLKRSHHELTTTKSDSGIIPRPIRLRTLLPADVRRVEAGKLPPVPDYTTVKQPDRLGRLAVLDSDGVVSIWSSLGGDLEESAMKLIHQFRVIDTAVQAGEAAVDLEELTDGPVLLVRSNDKLELWDVASCQFVQRLKNTTGVPIYSRFARTPRGIEVLAIESGANRIELRSLGDRSQSFSCVGITAIAPAVCYDDDSATLAAAAVIQGANHLLVWRDMGRPENATPFYDVSLNGTVVQQIESITLPGGLRYVLLLRLADGKTTIQLLDPDNKKLQAVAPLVGNTREIKSIAVDRRELMLTVAFGDGVEIYDLVGNAGKGKLAAEANTLVTVMHSNRQSYVICKASDGNKLVCGQFSRSDHGNELILNAVQDLPGPKAISFASQLQVARISNSSKDLVSLFHLWQRMGFCLDFAAQDARGELIGSSELEDLGHDIFRQMRDANGVIKINDKLHHAYLLHAEEHDAEFQPGDRVGFAFASVALVPDEFCAAALQFDPIF